MQKRKGFTLVELVIVIAVIAILAGVLIGTFASVINKANESAKMQELKAQEHEQKANDLLKKIEDSNWYGWEDFEASIVEKMTAAYKANGANVDTAKIAIELKSAIEEYAKAAAGNNTSLTEEQVKAIINNALGNLKFEGVTEAQVRAIVTTATSQIAATQLSAAQVKSIVTAANANNVTASQVSALLADQLKNVTTKDELTSTLNSVVSQITSEIADKALTKEDVENILKAYLPVTIQLDVGDADTLSTVASELVTGSTIELVGDWSTTDAIIEFPQEKTLTIKGSDVKSLTINAPAATVFVYNNGETLNTTAVAMSSLHIYGNWNGATISSGRLVLESVAKIKTVTVTPTGNASVNVFVTTNSTVDSVTVNGTEGTSVELKNEGTISEKVNVETTTVPVEITGVEIEKVIGSEQLNVTVDDNNVVELNQAKLDSLLSNNRYTLDNVHYKVVENLTLEAFLYASSETNTLVLDLNGYSIEAGESSIVVVTKGQKVVIKGKGTITSHNKWPIDIYAGAIFTLNDATIHGTSSSYVVYVGKGTDSEMGGTFIMNSGKVLCDGSWAVCTWGDAQGGNTSFIMNGGVIESNGFAITGSGNDSVYGSTWTVNSGRLISHDSNIVYHPNLGTFTINGGAHETQATGQSGIEMKAGTLVINGGSYSTTGTELGGAYIYGNGSSKIPSVVAIVKHPSYAGKINVTINGGTFTTPYEYVVGVFDEGDTTVTDPVTGKELGKTPVLGDVDDTKNNKGVTIVESFVINGGIFSSDVSKYVADGLTYDSGTGEVK